MSQRLTRKEIKEDIRHDELTTVLETTIQRFQENKNLILGSIAGVLIAVIVFASGMSWLDGRRADAQRDLAEVIRAADAPVDASGEGDDLVFSTEEDRRSAVRSHLEEVGGGPGRSKAAALASLYEARLALEEGDSATARSLWEDFLKSHSDDDAVAVSVKVNLLRLDREEGKAEDVATELRAELDRADGTLPEDLVLFELAETLRQLERTDEAMELYQQIIDEHPRSSYTGEARRHVTEG